MPKKLPKLYAMKSPKGEIFSWTLAETKSECWYNSFNALCHPSELGEKWRNEFWKRENASKKSAFQHGYKIISIKLTEVK